MSRRSRLPMPPRQSRIPIAGGVALDQVAQQKAIQEAQARVRVEGLAAGVFAQNIDIDAEDLESECINVAQRSIDSALIFAREVWGLHGQRVRPAAGPSDSPPPQPIIEG